MAEQPTQKEFKAVDIVSAQMFNDKQETPAEVEVEVQAQPAEPEVQTEPEAEAQTTEA